jgi:hypothetical protein
MSEISRAKPNSMSTTPDVVKDEEEEDAFELFFPARGGGGSHVPHFTHSDPSPFDGDCGAKSVVVVTVESAHGGGDGVRSGSDVSGRDVQTEQNSAVSHRSDYRGCIRSGGGSGGGGGGV